MSSFGFPIFMFPSFLFAVISFNIFVAYFKVKVTRDVEVDNVMETFYKEI